MEIREIDHYLHHRFRKHVATLQGLAGLMAHTHPTEEELRSFAALVEREADRLEEASRHMMRVWDGIKFRLARQDGPLSEADVALIRTVLREECARVEDETAYWEGGGPGLDDYRAARLTRRRQACEVLDILAGHYPPRREDACREETYEEPKKE